MRLKIILVILLLSGVAFAQGLLPEPKDGVTIYVVKPGDTLWNISKRFYGNPLLWPRLWELNSYIDNPNQIFPGQTLSLISTTPSGPELPVVKIMPEMKVEPLEDIGAPPPVYFYSRGGQEGFISPDEWEHMGTILSSEPPKILLGEGDIVYTNVGYRDQVQPGDRFTIFRSSKPVLHPFSGKRVGYKVGLMGELEILEVLGNRMSSAKIVHSYREITRGAKIRPLEPFVREVVMKKGAERTNGVVVESLNDIAVVGRGDIIYIDVGSDDSVVSGNTFSIYTYPRRSYDPDAGEDVVIPPSLKGKLVVFDVSQNSSTGLIIESARQIENGDLVSLDL